MTVNASKSLGFLLILTDAFRCKLVPVKYYSFLLIAEQKNKDFGPTGPALRRGVPGS